MKSKRNYQIAQLIQATLAQLLHTSVSDPRLKGVNITEVDLSPDLKKATVYFSILNPDQADELKNTVAAFKKASGFFRSQLSKLVEFRHTPELSFKFDDTLVKAENIGKLLGDP